MKWRVKYCEKLIFAGYLISLVLYDHYSLNLIAMDSAVVLLVDIDSPVETVSERLLEPVSVFNFGHAPGVGSVVVWGCVGNR